MIKIMQRKVHVCRVNNLCKLSLDILKKYLKKLVFKNLLISKTKIHILELSIKG